MKPLKSVKLIIIHCTATKSNLPFSTEKLIATGKSRFGQVSYHYYIRRDGSIEALLPENVQGVHARYYNHCSLGVVYEGGLNEKGLPEDTRTEAQKASLHSLLVELVQEYPEAYILGHCELPKQRVPIEQVLNWPSRDGSRQSQQPHVAKACPCFIASKAYAELQPSNRL